MQSKDEIRLAVKAAIEARKDEIIEVGRHIWKNPEPGYREVKTSAFLVDKLTKLGLKVKTGLGLCYASSSPICLCKPLRF